MPEFRSDKVVCFAALWDNLSLKKKPLPIPMYTYF